jgi:hypothetical protein
LQRPRPSILLDLERRYVGDAIRSGTFDVGLADELYVLARPWKVALVTAVLKVLKLVDLWRAIRLLRGEPVVTFVIRIRHCDALQHQHRSQWKDEEGPHGFTSHHLPPCQ